MDKYRSLAWVYFKSAYIIRRDIVAIFEIAHDKSDLHTEAYEYVLDTEGKESEELSEIMSILMFGLEGVTQESLDYCSECLSSANRGILESNVLLQKVSCTVADAESGDPISGAEIHFVVPNTEDKIFTTNENGEIVSEKAVLTPMNEKLAEQNSNNSINGILEKNDIDTAGDDNGFNTYTPETKTVIKEAYLPFGSYELAVSADGYEDYKLTEKINVQNNAECILGEFKLEKKDTIWRKLYCDKLTELIKSEPGTGMDGRYFDLVYVDDDNIPELVVKTGSAHADYSILFTIQDNTVICPSGSEDIGTGDYGEFCYLKKSGKYFVRCFINGYGSIFDVYDISGRKLHTYTNTSARVPGKTEIDGVEVTESQYNSAINQCIEDNAYREANFPYELTENTINRVLADSPQPVMKPENAYEGDSTFMVNTENGAMMYAGPGEYFDALNVIVPNEAIVSEKGSMNQLNNWIYTEYDGQEGWICTGDYNGTSDSFGNNLP